ncbi:MAG: hypothetical protein HY818_09615 [Acetobacterium woodii]|nr:hypothetical protein [Acetobacterium woodii]
MIITAIAVIGGLYYAKKNLARLNAQLNSARFSLALASKEHLILITALILTAVTLNLLDSLTITPFIYLTRLILSRLFIAFLTIVFLPSIFLLIYSFCAMYRYLEKRSSDYRLKQYHLKSRADLSSDPDFDGANKNIYTQIALVFYEKYDNPFVLYSLDRALRKLLTLRVMSQLLLTRTMKELAEETHETWDLSKVRAILYDRHFWLISRYLGLHVYLVFCVVCMMVEQQTDPIYRLIAQRSNYRRSD